MVMTRGGKKIPAATKTIQNRLCTFQDRVDHRQSGSKRLPERKNLLGKGTGVRSQEPELDPATQDSSPLRMGLGPFV